MRMLVAGGGTGGHFFPGLAVAEEAMRQGWSVLFVGARNGIEARVAPQRGLRFVPIEIHGVRGGGWRGLLRFVLQFPRAFATAHQALRSSASEVVLGLGGYGSVPVVISAWLRGTPAVLMEQNVHPGLANRVLARLARAVCTTFEDSNAFFPPGRAVLTGNPVRELHCDAHPDPAHFTVLVFGGSQGARSLNQAMIAAVPRLRRELGARLRILHQAGSPAATEVARAYAEAGVEAEVLPFIDDMAGAYARADLIVCRAGATTLAELAAVGRPAILVPYPFAADDHQRFNAQSLAVRGAAEMILDRELDGERLAARILHYADQPQALRAMAEAVRGFATPNATHDVLQVCRRAAQKEI